MHNEQTGSRIIAFDRLRAVTILWGVFFHAALSFTSRTPAYWITQDRYASTIPDLFVWASHATRMPTFFVMSGFFCSFLYRKIGAGEFVRHRLRRLGVPFLLGLLFLAPLNSALWMWSDLRYCSPHKPVCYTVFPALLSPEFLGSLIPGHLWFLYYLLIYSAIYLAVRRFGPVLFGSQAGVILRLRRTQQALLSHPLRVAILALPTAIPLMFMRQWYAPDAPIEFGIPVQTLVFYFLFFAFGVLLDDSDTRFRGLTSGVRSATAVALGTALVLWVLLPLGDRAQPGWLGALVHGLSACFTWAVVLALVGWFLRRKTHSPREASRWRYLADASYWIYLIHVPVVAGLQAWAAPLDLAPLLKYLFILVLVFAFSLMTYQKIVRFTWIGSLLHGPRG